MSEMMRGLCLNEDRQLELREFPVPEPKRGYVRAVSYTHLPRFLSSFTTLSKHESVYPLLIYFAVFSFIV